MLKLFSLSVIYKQGKRYAILKVLNIICMLRRQALILYHYYNEYY
jgi:hypothetical protein